MSDTTPVNQKKTSREVSIIESIFTPEIRNLFKLKKRINEVKKKGNQK